MSVGKVEWIEKVMQKTLVSGLKFQPLTLRPVLPRTQYSHGGTDVRRDCKLCFESPPLFEYEPIGISDLLVICVSLETVTAVGTAAHYVDI